MFSRFLSRKSLRPAAPLYLTLLLLALSLLISLAGGWVLYSLFREAKEDELDRRLIAIGQAADTSIPHIAEFVMTSLLEAEWNRALPTDGDEDAWRLWFEALAEYTDLSRLGRELEQLKQNAGLSSVLLISPQKRVIADANRENAPGSPAPLIEIDRFAWEPALSGEIGASVPYYEFAGVPYKRVYVPVHVPAWSGSGMAGQIGAVLRLEGSLEAFRQIAAWRAQVLFLAGVVTALMGTVAFVFYRLIRVFVRIEARAAHRDRLEAMGLLAAGIAHEIRNPLGIIRALSEAISADVRQDDPMRELLHDIVGEVERLNALVTQYLTFARPDAIQPGDQADPGDEIRVVAALLDKGAKNLPHIEVEIGENIPRVPMNVSALRQVLLNLLMNAREASLDTQPVAIRCQTLRGGSEVEIVIQDWGTGISPKDRKHVFTPFFSTKAKGSGLGLAICRYLVTECGGTISLESEPGAGTTVRVLLPAA